jgi:hypothetical protein
MILRALLILLGIAHVSNGIVMLVAPESWYAAVPGVSMTGPLNPHFILDIAMAYLASGAGLLLGTRRGVPAACAAVAGATWPALHGLIHIAGWSMHGLPADPKAAFAEAFGVVFLGALGVVLAWLRVKEER